MTRLYENPTPIDRLDARGHGYRFDLDRDVQWDRFDEPGLYFTDTCFFDIGIDPAPFRDKPAAFAELQWATAVLLCQEFFDLERTILRFAAQKKRDVPDSIALQALIEEEGKHITLFTRYQKRLRAQHPAWAAHLDEAVGDLPRWRYDLGEQGDLDDVSFHYLVWLNILFFEEDTIYLHHRLAEGDDVQPCWLSAHACHRQEEAQHVVTDSAYLASLGLPETEVRRLSRLFVENLMTHFAPAAPYRAAARSIARRHLDLDEVPAPSSAQAAQGIEQILTHRAFSRTRRAAPALGKMIASPP